MDGACRQTSESTSSSASTKPTLRGETAGQGSALPSRAGSLTSTAAASSRPTARTAARGFSSTCLSYRALKARADDGRMYDVEPQHAIGPFPALLAPPPASLSV